MLNEGALEGVRVLDLTDARGIYGVKLLADLGANVVRPEPLGGDPLRKRAPHLDSAADGCTSLWHAFFASNRSFFALDLDSVEGQNSFRQLINRADIVVTCSDGFGVVRLEQIAAERDDLIVINTNSFSNDGPWCDYLAPDLVAGALGGAVATTGDADTPPLKTFGDLNFMVSGVYVAIASLSALFHKRKAGEGQSVGVSVHECLVSCLEQVLMFYWYADNILARPEGKVLPRRGATHWSNAYTVMNGKNGAIMVTPTPDFDSQLAWLIEEDVHDDLIDPKYSEPENLPLLIGRTMEILKDWVAGKDVEALFFEAQRRHSPYGWVLPIEKVADNPQLDARGWYQPYSVGGVETKAPGAPYQFSATPWSLREYASPQVQAQDVLNDVGWGGASSSASARGNRNTGTSDSESQSEKPKRPLDGLKVLDFSHVLAGPFATRVLGDMGADVVKINSASRATGANDPAHAYYIMWNRNKRALALDMSNPDSLVVCRQLCEQADIVIDNFSVGVLDRWGVGYDSVSQANPGVIYVQMSGMGDGGPWSKFVTYAPTIHALAGLTHLTGVEGRQDLGIGFSYNDHQAGLHGAVAILASLEARARTGKGQRVDVSQFEVGVNFAGPALMDLFANGNAARPTGNADSFEKTTPHDVYQCLSVDAKTTVDERWIAIVCETDKQWSSLVRLMDSPDWATDAKFSSVTGRYAERALIDQKISDWTASQDDYALMELCQSEGVPAGVVQNGIDLAERDPELARRKFLMEFSEQHPLVGRTYADRLPLTFSKTPCNDYQRARVVGEDNDAVLESWLGLSADEIESTRQSGVLR